MNRSTSEMVTVTMLETLLSVVVCWYGVGCRVEGCAAVAAGCPVSGWWRAGQCLGGINLVKVAATAWAGLGWYSLGWAGLGWAGLVVDRVDTQWWCPAQPVQGGEHSPGRWWGWGPCHHHTGGVMSRVCRYLHISTYYISTVHTVYTSTVSTLIY